VIVCTLKGFGGDEVEHHIRTSAIANVIPEQLFSVLWSVSTYNSYLVITKMAMLQYCYNIGYTVDEEKGFITLYSFF